MGMDLSYFEQLMGGGAEEPGAAAGGIWVVSPEGPASEDVLRLVGKARVAADSLGSYVHLLLAGYPKGDDPQPAIKAGADRVLITEGTPTLSQLADFLRERSPQAVLLPRTRLGRVLGPGLAEALEGGLVGYAADLAVDTASQRLVAHQPILGDTARRAMTILKSPAVVVLDTGALPAPFSEPWRTGQVEDAGVTWPAPEEYPSTDLPAFPLTLANAEVVVAAGRGLKDADGFAIAERLAGALGGVVAGDIGAFDAGWIGEDQLVGLTGHRVAPKLYLALGITGDDAHFMALREAGTIVAVQQDPAAPIVPVADWNILAEPVEVARDLLSKLSGQN